MLHEALILPGVLLHHCHKLASFFTRVTAQVTTSFDETLQTFFDTTRIGTNPKITEADLLVI